MPFPSNGFARLAGQAGDRRRQGAIRAARRRQKYLTLATEMAAERGLTPTQDDLERAAKALAEADLAKARLAAWNALAGSKGGPS
jgi:hypothetical protein